VNEFAVLVKKKIQERQECQCECIDVSERANKLVDNVVNALNVTSPRKKFRIPKVWEGKKWFSDEIREAADRRHTEEHCMIIPSKIGRIKMKEMQ